MSSIWQRVADLDAVEWGEDVVAVCDERLISRVPAALRARTVAVAGGESLKRLSQIEALAEAVLEVRASRPMTIVAIGGGSVGDAVGFLASVLWRGVPVWHVPTTLLAAVDSAHGGKTAVNLGESKNQIGTFWAAERIILAEAFLADLPVHLRAEGLTELVKGLWLAAPDALDALDAATVGRLASAPWEEVAGELGRLLDAAVDAKQRIVAQDPREELGIRTVLNLGHTIAHGLELLCGASHGVGVAWGLAAAAQLSMTVGFSSEDRDRMWRQVAPLMGRVPLEVERAPFAAVVSRDKRTVQNRLRSVLLKGPGQPVVVDSLTAEDWYEAMRYVRKEVFDAPCRLELRGQRPASLSIAASKSEMNRALAIAALRKGETRIEGHSDAEDVRAMRAGIASLQSGEIADAKNGGTTFRFLAAVAVSTAGGGSVRIGEQLAARPHEPLLNALREAGATIRERERVFDFGPLPEGPIDVEVDASRSSQFASAIAMLAASGRPATLRPTSAGITSRGYFDMTLSMLEAAGIGFEETDGSVTLRPLDTDVTVTLRPAPDASSAALWHVLRRLGFEVEFPTVGAQLQPDAAAEQLLWARDAEGIVELDIGDTPDLVPVFAAYATRSQPAVLLRGAPHLRDKESNRIDDLVAAFAEVGVEIEPLSDGVRVPAGLQTARSGATFDPRGDHRLAFAAIVLASAANLRLLSPRCVTKSYPEVFEHARSVGYLVEMDR